MTNASSVFSKKSVVAALAFALGAGGLWSLSVRAEDPKTESAKMGSVSAEDRQMMTSEIAKMKAMAANPQDSEKLKAHMVKMITMDHMAKKMAADPACRQACSDALDDPAIKKLHEEAEQSAMDPAEMAKLEKQISNDPVLMKVVMHHALTMSMMPALKPESKEMDNKMKGMEDKVKDLGGQLMEKK